MSVIQGIADDSGKAEEALQLTEGDLDKQTSLVAELTKTVCYTGACLTSRSRT